MIQQMHLKVVMDPDVLLDPRWKPWREFVGMSMAAQTLIIIRNEVKFCPSVHVLWSLRADAGSIFWSG